MPHSKKFTAAGLVLTEALIAVATLAFGVVALGSITNNAISTAILSKDYLVAGGLVKEGVEAVKDIRYSNWLLKPNDTATCWLRLVPDNTSDPNCGYTASTTNYIVTSNNGSWSMQSAGGAVLNLDSESNPRYTLYLDSNPDTAGYYASLSNLAANSTTITASRYYRSVNFTKVDSNSATFTVTVEWKDGAKTRDLNKTITIYNYQ